MRDEIKEEVEKQLRDRDRARKMRWARWGVVVMLFTLSVAWAQNQTFGGQHQMADLFKVFFTWDATSVTVASTRSLQSSVASGSEAVTLSNGQRIKFGAGANNFVSGDATRVTFGGIVRAQDSMEIDTGGGLWLNGTTRSVGFLLSGTENVNSGASAFRPSADNTQTLGTAANRWSTGNIDYVRGSTPFTLSSVYVNGTLLPVTYGGGTLPAQPFTVTDIAYSVRASGTGGTTNNYFRVANVDGGGNCTCAFACNQGTGPQDALCVNDAGTGCVYAASTALTYAFPLLGDCSVATDVSGNIDVRGKWQ